MAVKANAGQVCHKITKKIPAKIRLEFHIFLILTVSKRIEKKIYVNVGRTTIPRIKADIKAKVLVKASG